MIPPPENEYKSREDLLSAAQSWALGHGYAVTIKRSVAGKNVQLKCDRGGANVLQEKEKKRQTTSRRIDCPFLLSGNFSKKTGKWKLKTKVSDHNHEQSPNPSGHPIHRKLTAA